MNINIKIDKNKFDRLIDNLPKKIAINIPSEINGQSDETVRALQFGFINGNTKTDRSDTASKFRWYKKSQNKWAVSIPSTASNLDSMTPHYVAMKPGRNATKWARRYFGTMTKSGKSRINFRGQSNSIVYNDKFKSALYVTPDPFVQTALDKTIPNLIPRVMNGVKKSIMEATL